MSVELDDRSDSIDYSTKNVYQEPSRNGIPYLRAAALVFADFKIHLDAPIDFSVIYEAFTTYLILTLEFLHEIRSELLRHQGYTI